MKILLIVLALIAGHAHAATVPMSAPTGVTHASGGWTTASNFVGSFSGASFNNTFTANVGGKAVTMPAAQRMAANAGQFAANAVRFNPAGLLSAAVAAWLLSKGLEYLDGEWKKRQQPDPAESDSWCYRTRSGGAKVCTLSELAAAYAYYWPHLMPHGNPYFATENGNPAMKVCRASDPTFCFVADRLEPAPLPSPEPATQADWDQFNGQPLPDAAANDLANKSALPLQNPQWNNPYKDVPLSDPKIDPVTGQKYRDAARVTPNADGTSADVEPYREPLDENGDPIPDETKPGETQKEAEPDRDPCETATDRLSCLQKGEADDVELENKNEGSSVSPVSVGGGGSCPADKVIALHGGTATFSYQPICQLASMINPLVIAFAWLSAGFILIGAFRE